MMKKNLTRKEFLRLALVASGGALLGACSSAAQPAQPAAPAIIVTSTPKPEPSATALPSPTPAASATPASSPTALPATLAPAASGARRPEIIRFYPQIPSRVVHAHQPGVWQGDQLDPNAIGRMLDHAITRLTGLNDASEAWQALFAPDERVGIKVNTIRNAIYWTHVPLVSAVTDRLVSAGLKPENLLVFDRDSDELEGAGFKLNKDGDGVRCYGSELRFKRLEQIGSYQVGISDLVYEVDALINMPILKTHSLAGITFGMKNHYGTFDSPGMYHYAEALVAGITGLNALPVIKERTRLVIGDALTACLRESPSWPYWNSAATGDSIFMSYDPVAHDAAALRYWSGLLKADGGDPRFAQKIAATWLAKGAELGLGAHDDSQIEYLEETLA